MEDPNKKVGVLKQLTDKIMRKFTGKLEGTKQAEINQVVSTYQLYFSDLPEVLNVGKDYSNLMECSVGSFRIDYWTKQLKGYFYNQMENFIGVMCSYEYAKIERLLNYGYTNDPVHILFFVIKCWAVKLSSTHFDEEDIDEARRWQLYLKDLIIRDVFKASNDDSRVQVLFKLEHILRTQIIPHLICKKENKSAQDQLRTVSSHLEKFFSHVFKYLFYVARESKYVPNFSYTKLLSLSDPKAYPEAFHLTELERDGWSPLKGSMPLKWLTNLLLSDTSMVTQMSPLSISDINADREQARELCCVNQFRDMSVQVPDKFECEKNKYASHIPLHEYVNTHVFMQELIHFRQLFSAAEQVAEMGGNLLAFGLLRSQLSEDIADCLQCLHLIMVQCQKLEDFAWKAHMEYAFGAKDKGLKYASEEWRKNYSMSAQNYFVQLSDEYEYCRRELSHLAAIASKKTTALLLKETEEKLKAYLLLHNQHSSHRYNLLSNFNALNNTLRLIQLGQLNNNNGSRAVVRESPKALYRKAKELGKIATSSQAKEQDKQEAERKGREIGVELASLAQDPTCDVSTLYYTCKFFGFMPLSEGQIKMRADCLRRIREQTNGVTSHLLFFQEAKLFADQKNYDMAKERLEDAARCNLSAKFQEKHIDPLFKTIQSRK